jgi:hypothetical protein
VTISSAQLGYLLEGIGGCRSGPIGRRWRADAAECCDMATLRSSDCCVGPGWCG